MFAKFLEALRSIPLTKAAAIVNWVCFTPVAIAVLWGWITDNGDVIFHPVPLLALALLGFAYAVLLSIDADNELFRESALFNTPRWLWRWICVAWGVLMVVIIFFLYIHPF